MMVMRNARYNSKSETGTMVAQVWRIGEEFPLPIAFGNKIRAIRWVRTVTGLDLKEAKGIVDWVWGCVERSQKLGRTHESDNNQTLLPACHATGVDWVDLEWSRSPFESFKYEGGAR